MVNLCSKICKNIHVLFLWSSYNISPETKIGVAGWETACVTKISARSKMDPLALERWPENDAD